jgi:hypothetical protein
MIYVNIGDCLIEVTIWAGVTVCDSIPSKQRSLVLNVRYVVSNSSYNQIF